MNKQKIQEMQVLDRLKARVSPGDTVRFPHQNRRLRGVVRALGPRYAGVAAADGEYRVPYELIRPAKTARDHFAAEQGALEHCRRLLRRHGLANWSARLDDSASRAAACDHFGCSARRCHDIEFGPPKWIMHCPGGCFAIARNRRTRGLVCMQCSRAPRFLRWNKTQAARFGMPTFD